VDKNESLKVEPKNI